MDAFVDTRTSHYRSLNKLVALYKNEQRCYGTVGCLTVNRGVMGSIFRLDNSYFYDFFKCLSTLRID